MSKVTVVPGDPPVPKEILAEAIVRISGSLDSLSRSGLNEEAIIVLVAADIGIPKRDIRAVLHSLGDLRRKYCR